MKDNTGSKTDHDQHFLNFSEVFYKCNCPCNNEFSGDTVQRQSHTRHDPICLPYNKCFLTSDEIQILMKPCLCFNILKEKNICRLASMFHENHTYA